MTAPAPVARPPRRRNPRLVVKATLRAIRADLAASLERWSVRRTVFDFKAPRDKAGNVPLRDRASWEWPEWRLDDWAVLSRELDHIDDQVAGLRDLIADQVARLHCDNGCGRPLKVTEARAGYTRCEHCPQADQPAAS
jgi:hypothetical protein